MASFVGVLVVVVTSPAFGWITRLPGTATVSSLATDAKGDVFAVSARPHVDTSLVDNFVVKLDGRTGRERWRTPVAPGQPLHQRINVLMVAANGDAVVAGRAGHPLGREASGFFVARFAGGTGRPRWRRAARPSAEIGGGSTATTLAFDPEGDVVAAGGLAAGRFGLSDFFVMKLAALTGATLWQVQIDGGAGDLGEDHAVAAMVDASGNAVVVGAFTRSYPPAGAWDTLTLDRSTGAVLSRVELAEPGSGALYQIFAPHGDVVHVGSGLTRVAGSTGERLWDSPSGFGVALQTVVTLSGDFATVSSKSLGCYPQIDPTDGCPPPPSFTAAAVDGTTGAERWRRNFTESSVPGTPGGIAVTPDGNVVVVGTVRNAGTCDDVFVARLSAGTGDVLATRTMDGRAHTASCEPDPYCFLGDVGGPAFECPRPRRGSDADQGDAVAVDRRGRVFVGGALADGPRATLRGFVASVRLVP